MINPGKRRETVQHESSGVERLFPERGNLGLKKHKRGSGILQKFRIKKNKANEGTPHKTDRSAFFSKTGKGKV